MNDNNIRSPRDEINSELDKYFTNEINYHPNIKENENNTPNSSDIHNELFSFIVNNNFKEFKLKFTKNIDLLNKLSTKGFYLLHFSCFLKKNNFISFLIKNNASPYKKDSIGKTAMHYSILSGNKSTVNLLFSLNCDFNVKDFDGDSPFHYAVSNNDENIIDVLIKNNADPFIKNNNNFTPLNYSIKNQNIYKKIKLYSEKYKSKN